MLRIAGPGARRKTVAVGILERDRIEQVFLLIIIQVFLVDSLRRFRFPVRLVRHQIDLIATQFGASEDFHRGVVTTISRRGVAQIGAGILADCFDAIHDIGAVQVNRAIGDQMLILVLAQSQSNLMAVWLLPVKQLQRSCSGKIPMFGVVRPAKSDVFNDEFFDQKIGIDIALTLTVKRQVDGHLLDTHRFVHTEIVEVGGEEVIVNAALTHLFQRTQRQLVFKETVGQGWIGQQQY